jgi:hypothetical protein
MNFSFLKLTSASDLSFDKTIEEISSGAKTFVSPLNSTCKNVRNIKNHILKGDTDILF